MNAFMATRKYLVTAVLFAAGMIVVAIPAQAQYPTKPIRIFLPFGPGGVGDVTLRLVTSKVTERTNMQFVIENRPSAGGIASAMAAKTSAPDGYTLLLLGNSAAIGASLFPSLPFDALKDFAPVSSFAQFDMLLATRTAGATGSIAKLREVDRATPGKLNFGSIASGSTQNLAAEMFKVVSGSQAAVVTFRTSQDLLLALQRGDIDVGFDYLAAFAPALSDGQLTIIASAGEQRSPLTPNVPTIAESGWPEYVVTSWNGVAAPAGTPKDIIEKLNKEINEVLKQPDVRDRITTLGMEAVGTTPDGMALRLLKDTERWRGVITRLGLQK